MVISYICRRWKKNTGMDPAKKLPQNGVYNAKYHKIVLWKPVKLMR
jgi:hypothetical protein